MTFETSTPEQILIVDDAEVNAELLSEYLSGLGYQAQVAHDASQALIQLEQFPIDLILLDINMPGIDGYTFCQQLKAAPTYKHIPVIFVSALNATFNKVRAFEVGGADYVSKPLVLDEVRVRIETQLQRLRQQHEIEQLRQAEITQLKEINQLKDEMLRIASHDLKSPLSSIIGYTDLLKMEMREKDQLDADNARHLEGITQSANKMLRLIRDLLDLSRIEGSIPLEVMPINLTEYLQVAYNEFAIQALEHAQRLVYSPPPSPLMITVSPERFYQAVSNLLSNACKYTPDGGTVSFGYEQRGEEVAIWVSDTGIGIPTDAIPQLFGKFYRVQTAEHRKRTGTGLGLSIVKAVIEQHGGQINVESELGKGTRFTIRLPLK